MKRALWILLLVASLPAGAATYYVRTGGSDSNNCTDSGANACASVQRVINLIDLNANDIIDIGAGTFRGPVRLCNNTSGFCSGHTTGSNDEGTGGAPIVIRGAGPDQTFIQPTVDLNDAGFTATPGYANVYQISIATTLYGVYETVWNNTVRVDDTSVTRVVYDFDTPVSYSTVTSLAEVQSVSGSYWQSGGILYVHMWDDGNPVTAGRNLEGVSSNYGFLIQGSSSNSLDYITVRDLTIRYGPATSGSKLVTLGTSSSVPGYADYVTFDNVDIYSSGMNGFVVSGGADNGTFRNGTVKNVQVRGAPTGTLTKNQGWVDGGAGDAFGFDVANWLVATGWTIEDNVFENSWEVVNTYGLTNSTIRGNLIRNSPNHAIIMKHEGGAGCSDILVERNVVYNGQESFYVAGCTDIRFSRNAGQLTTTNEGRAPGAVTWRSNLTCYQGSSLWCISAIAEVVAAGWSANYNWYYFNAAAWQNGECRYNGVEYDQCDDVYQAACNCDAQSIDNAASVQLAGATWPIAAGLAAGELPISAFYLNAGSPLIDAGDPDIDGDGVVETTRFCSGGTEDGNPCDTIQQQSSCVLGGGTCPVADDACTVANHCFGSAPDIGPFEYGIDAPPESVCGNGTIDLGETCDDGSVDVNACVYGDSPPYTQVCNSTCTGTTDCVSPMYCGDGVVNGGEACDGSQLNGQSCVSQGFTGGTLTCSAGCTFDTSACTTGGGTQCSDGLDNDADGYTDLNDIGCSSASDTTETRMTGTTWSIPCTDDGYLQARRDMCSAGGGITVNFNCTNTTIFFDFTGYTPTDLEIPATCHNNIIDGETRNIVLEPTAAHSWVSRSTVVTGTPPVTLAPPCGGATCDPDSDGIPEGCPNGTQAEEQYPRFMMVRGDNNQIRNLTIRKWGDGIGFNGTDGGSTADSHADNNVVSGVTCEFPGDKCFANEGDYTAPGTTGAARNNLIQNSAAKYACDKAIQIYGRQSGWSSASDYDVRLLNVTCTDNNGCIRANGYGYFVVDNLVVNEVAPPENQSMYTCNYGLRISINPAMFKFNGGSMSGCDIGIWGDNGSPTPGDGRVIVDGMTFTNTNVGFDLHESHDVTLQNVTFAAGGSTTGVIVRSDNTGNTDAGGGSITYPAPIGTISSTGGNKFGGNTTGISNQRSGYTVRAENNCWDDADPSNEVSGTVDYTPLASGATCGVASVCGNNTVEVGEVCDDGNTVTESCSYGDAPPLAQVCQSNCAAVVDCINPQYCGDGTRNGPEACDNAQLGGATCISLGFSGGTLRCYPNCNYNTASCTVPPNSRPPISGGLIRGGTFR